MARNLSNWIHAWMEYTNDTESPDAYHFWSGVTIIGAATKRRIWLTHLDKIFPNHYTIIVGPSGARKSSAVSLAAKVAGMSGIRKFSDKLTEAVLIKDLSESTEKFIDGSNIEFVSPLLVYSSELGVFMGVDAYGSGVIPDLTDLYDCGGPEGKWEKKTIVRDSEVILGPFVSLLAASTPQTLKDVLPPASVGQGFTSRVIFVWGGGRRKKIPMPNWDDGHRMLEANLVHDLKQIEKLYGEMKMDQSALKCYVSNYLNRPEPEEEYEDERFRGYSSRKDIHILKLAMILSLAGGDSMIISERNILEATEAFNWLDRGLPNIFSGHGTSATVEDTTRVFREIDAATRRAGFARHSDIVRRNFHSVNAQELQVVFKTLLEGGAIEEVVVKDQSSGKMVRTYRSLDPNFLGALEKKFPKKLKGG